MNTTNLFVELIVIGAGVFTWVILLVFALFGLHWLPLDHVFLLFTAIPGLAIVYVSGILWDRLADVIFNRLWGNALRAQIYPKLGEYYDDRRNILTRAPALAELLEYGRSRLRICRGWAMNALLIGVCFNLFCWRQLGSKEDIIAIALFASISSLIFAFGAWWAWRNLTLTEYRKIKDQSTYLDTPSGQSSVNR